MCKIKKVFGLLLVGTILLSVASIAWGREAYGLAVKYGPNLACIKIDENNNSECENIVFDGGDKDFSWCWNNNLVAYILRGSLYVKDLSVSEDRQVATATSDYLFETPNISPDGQKIAYIKCYQNMTVFHGGELWVEKMDGSLLVVPEDTLDGAVTYRCPVWLDNDKLMVFYGIHTREKYRNYPRIIQIDGKEISIVKEKELSENDSCYWTRNDNVLRNNKYILLKSCVTKNTCSALLFDAKNNSLIKEIPDAMDFVWVEDNSFATLDEKNVLKLYNAKGKLIKKCGKIGLSNIGSCKLIGAEKGVIYFQHQRSDACYYTYNLNTNKSVKKNI